jgi:hypothetical protein
MRGAAWVADWADRMLNCTRARDVYGTSEQTVFKQGLVKTARGSAKLARRLEGMGLEALLAEARALRVACPATCPHCHIKPGDGAGARPDAIARSPVYVHCVGVAEDKLKPEEGQRLKEELAAAIVARHGGEYSGAALLYLCNYYAARPSDKRPHAREASRVPRCARA